VFQRVLKDFRVVTRCGEELEILSVCRDAEDGIAVSIAAVGVMPVLKVVPIENRICNDDAM